MNKKDKVIFTEYCYEFANRFLYCVCADTTDKYIKTFSKFRYWRLLDDLEFKYNISINASDNKVYKKYEKVMIEVLSKRIEQCKTERIEKEKLLKEKNKNKTK